jgi:hypothetical protein
MPLKRLATLTAEEDARWDTLFPLAVNEGMTDEQAAADAWAGLQEEFPRLRSFDGCHAKADTSS